MTGIDLMVQLGEQGTWKQGSLNLNVDDGPSASKGINLFADADSTFPEDEDPDQYMSMFEGIRKDIDEIEEHTGRIQTLRNQYLGTTEPAADKKIMEQLDLIMAENNTVTRRIKKSLQQAKDDNDKYEKNSSQGSSVTQWRKNQLNTITKRFKSSLADFQKTLNQFNSTLKEKQTRQIKISNTEKKLSDEEIEEIASDPEQAAQFIQKQFQLHELGDEMTNRLVEIEERHEGMLKIQKSIKELQEMWQELNILITEQQELLDNIEKNVSMTKDYVQSAHETLKKAEKHQKTARKYQLLGLICCIIVVVILMSIVFGTKII